MLKVVDEMEGTMGDNICSECRMQLFGDTEKEVKICWRCIEREKTKNSIDLTKWICFYV